METRVTCGDQGILQRLGRLMETRDTSRDQRDRQRPERLTDYHAETRETSETSRDQTDWQRSERLTETKETNRNMRDYYNRRETSRDEKPNRLAKRETKRV